MSAQISLRGMLRLIRVDTLRPQCWFSRMTAHMVSINPFPHTDAL